MKLGIVAKYGLQKDDILLIAEHEVLDQEPKSL